MEFYKLRDHEQDVYNIAFGDWDGINNCINDRDKVLATVAATLVDFMNDRPMALILAIGSTKSRTRFKGQIKP